MNLTFYNLPDFHAYINTVFFFLSRSLKFALCYLRNSSILTDSQVAA